MKRWRWRLVMAGLMLGTGPAAAQAPTAVPVDVPLVETAPPPMGGAGCAASVAPGTAKGPYGSPGQIFYRHTQTAPPPAISPTESGPATYVPPNYPAVKPDPANPRPIRVCLQKLGVGCWSHVNSIGCGSFHADMQFIFGSCRSFFGEPCQHGPPPITPATPMPPPNVAPYGILALTPLRSGMTLPAGIPVAPVVP